MGNNQHDGSPQGKNKGVIAVQVQVDQKSEIVNYASEKKAFVDEKAIELLKDQKNFREIIDTLLKEGIFFINSEAVGKKLIKTRLDGLGPNKVTVENKGFKPIAKEHDGKIRVLSKYDVTGQSKSEGKTENFLHYFRRKFELLSQILKRRQGLSPRPIARVKLIPKGNKVDVIGMVLRKWVTKKGHVGLEIEDLESKCIALLIKNDIGTKGIAERVLVDSVIAIKAIKWNEDLLIVKEVLWPDMPVRQARHADTDFTIASTSDFHMGSRFFLEKECNHFINWINGREGGEKEQEKVGKIKYLVITGDNVDGVGIYPNQINELVIKDIYKQYEEFSKLIEQIPEYIEIVICPGQHDAVRWADPQPAVPKEYLPELNKRKNIHFVGSPGWIDIEGLKIMMYHGGALHDLIGSVGYLNSEHPEEAMIEVLKKRDIMSTYGMKQPYVPEREDYLVIREEPDLVYIGDMHHNAYGSYRGTTVINSGTWQSRTDYQVKLGHVPTPGIVPIYNLKTGKISENYFVEKKD